MNEKVAKNQFNRIWVRRLIYRNHGGISRQELIRQTGLNPRTVDTYTASLENSGAITRKTLLSGQKQLGVWYYPNSNNVAFLGIHHTSYGINCMLLDINSGPLCLRCFKSGELGDVETFTGKLQEMLAEFSRFRLMGIGMISRYYHQKLNDRAFFNRLSQHLPEALHAPVLALDSNTALLYSIYLTLNILHPIYNHGRSINLGLICPSDRVHFGLMIDGEPTPFQERVPAAQKESLRGVMTHEAILKELHKLNGNTISSIEEYREAVFIGDPRALEISELEAVQLAAAAVRLKNAYRLDKIFLIHVVPKTVQRVTKLLEHEGIGVEPAGGFSLQQEFAFNYRLAIKAAFGGSISELPDHL